ncbi:FecR family protein [Arsenicibacter rosenii]|uniref:Iron dicitrate transport regulator FecR n=1 Tax=Arsenicibacter rosenii TaxID=1750698 RepID=A0A1S2VB50_9BACT|nr:FecR domain-containing protein [Arsenicibacter rosenii]OIN55535.1 hypothetical protein BLX24_29655 [Arsenicibacter rosenii]
MNQPLNKKIIFDYFDGKHTSIQRKMIEEWLHQPENKELFYQFLDEWEAQHPQYHFDAARGFNTIQRNIAEPAQDTDLSNSLTDSPFSILRPLLTWMAAASVALVCLFWGWKEYTKPNAPTYERLARQIKQQSGEVFEKENLSNKPLLVNLPDKSSILLGPGSKISYSPRLFGHPKREVVLLGEAFFEVSKDPERPFFVYANQLITKVLGTSFSISTKRGRSEVALQSDTEKDQKLSGNTLKGLVIAANEKVNVGQDQFTIQEVKQVLPVALPNAMARTTFTFDEAPANDVIEKLKAAYHADIVYDAGKLAHCKLTAHLTDEPLLEKIELICIAIEATYREENNKIIITSNGCR